MLHSSGAALLHQQGDMLLDELVPARTARTAD